MGLALRPRFYSGMRLVFNSTHCHRETCYATLLPFSRTRSSNTTLWAFMVPTEHLDTIPTVNIAQKSTLSVRPIFSIAVRLNTTTRTRLRATVVSE